MIRSRDVCPRGEVNPNPRQVRQGLEVLATRQNLRLEAIHLASGRSFFRKPSESRPKPLESRSREHAIREVQVNRGHYDRRRRGRHHRRRP